MNGIAELCKLVPTRNLLLAWINLELFLAPWMISQDICFGREEEDVAPTAPVRPPLGH